MHLYRLSEFPWKKTEKQCEITVVNPDFTGYRHSDKITSPYAKQLQDALNKSDHREEYHLERSTKTKSRDKCQKKLITNIDQKVNSDRVPLSILREFDEKVSEMKKEIFRTYGMKIWWRKRVVN